MIKSMAFASTLLLLVVASLMMIQLHHATITGSTSAVLAQSAEYPDAWLGSGMESSPLWPKVHDDPKTHAFAKKPCCFSVDFLGASYTPANQTTQFCYRVSVQRFIVSKWGFKKCPPVDLFAVPIQHHNVVVKPADAHVYRSKYDWSKSGLIKFTRDIAPGTSQILCFSLEGLIQVDKHVDYFISGEGGRGDWFKHGQEPLSEYGATRGPAKTLCPVCTTAAPYLGPDGCDCGISKNCPFISPPACRAGFQFDLPDCCCKCKTFVCDNPLTVLDRKNCQCKCPFTAEIAKKKDLCKHPLEFDPASCTCKCPLTDLSKCPSTTNFVLDQAKCRCVQKCTNGTLTYDGQCFCPDHFLYDKSTAACVPARVLFPTDGFPAWQNSECNCCTNGQCDVATGKCKCSDGLVYDSSKCSCVVPGGGGDHPTSAGGLGIVAGQSSNHVIATVVIATAFFLIMHYVARAA